MTLGKAKEKLRQARELIFEVEKTMDIYKSTTRRLGFNCRIAVADFENVITNALDHDKSAKIDSL